MVSRLPLDDVTVLDLTVARAGPTCVRQLADWGANVVRVEPPEDAEASSATMGRRHGSDFQNLHRNKRSLSLDLKTAEGHDILMRLVDRSDVLVENMRPPVKARLGFDYDTVHARNPSLVYGSISGFGQDGPYGERGGFDQIVQGMGGLMSVTGTIETGPIRAGIPVVDLSTGLYLAVGILVALHDRERTGEGRWVQTSLLESMIAMLDLQGARWTVDHDNPKPEGNHHPTLIPMGCYGSSDGYVNIAAPWGRLLHDFCAAIGLPDLPKDARFDTPAKRSANRTEMNALIEAKLREQTTAHWVELLNEVGVPCGPVYSVEEVFSDPQVRHLEMTQAVTHESLGEINILRNAVRMTGTGPTVRTPAPEPGEQNAEVLAELGFDEGDVADLRQRGIV